MIDVRDNGDIADFSISLHEGSLSLFY
jgi:hypothetical protein